jgi:hypothetical protein
MCRDFATCALSYVKAFAFVLWDRQKPVSTEAQTDLRLNP